MLASTTVAWVAATTLGVACGLSFHRNDVVRRFVVSSLIAVAALLVLTTIPSTAAVLVGRVLWTLWGLIAVSAAAVVIWCDSRPFRLAGLCLLCLCSVAPPVAMNHPTTLFSSFGIAFLAFLTANSSKADAKLEPPEFVSDSAFHEPWLAAFAVATFAFLLLSSPPSSSPPDESRRAGTSQPTRRVDTGTVAKSASTRDLILRGGLLGLIVLTAVVARFRPATRRMCFDQQSTSAMKNGDSEFESAPPTRFPDSA